MPTIIALDVSLSMTRAIPAATNKTNEENITYHQLAVHGIHEFLTYLTANSKLEYVCLLQSVVCPRKYLSVGYIVPLGLYLYKLSS